jgi:mRNA-degrading endonuclease RelE of RelBE toxin-antitoxin system
MQSLAQAREWVTEAGFDCDAGAESLYRIRVGEYRIIYQVLHESREVIVSSIRHRSVAYRGV